MYLNKKEYGNASIWLRFITRLWLLKFRSCVVLSSKSLCHRQTENANYCHLILSIYAQEMTNKSRLGASKCLILFVCQKHSSYIVFYCLHVQNYNVLFSFLSKRFDLSYKNYFITENVLVNTLKKSVRSTLLKEVN